MSVAARLSKRRDIAIQKAWVQYAFVAVGLATILLTVSIAFSPSLYAMVVEHILLPRYETKFGFRGGRVTIDDGTAPHTRYAIIDVTPRGRLEQLGLRIGDVPIDHHNGMVAFYIALRDADEGKRAEFMVVSKDEPSWEKRRSIKMSP